MQTLLCSSKPRLVCLTLLASLLVLLLGCGGRGHHGPSTGSIRFSVIWPPEPESRVIPTSAQSLLIQVKSGATVVASQLIQKPATTTNFTELPVGSLNVEVAAYATTDGTGTMLAWATVPTTIVSNNTANVDVTLASQIDHLEITPSPLTLGVLTSGTINVVAKDSNGNIVLVDPTSLSFSSNNTGVAAVDSSGNVTAGAAVGTATITVTEADSGKTQTVTISVLPNIVISPTTKTMTINKTQTFVATVTGTVNTAVTWSVQEGASGGTVTAGGVYTSPSTKGTYHVIATSVADTSRKATAVITVQSGGANVSIH